MSNFDDIKQKMKGKIQQGKGKYHRATGDDVQGIVETLKGKFNEDAADMKMHIKRQDHTNSSW